MAVTVRTSLYELTGAGLVISAATGVVYSNQAGGHSCQQPSLEGFYVPLGDTFEIVGSLRKRFAGPPSRGNCKSGIEVADADFIDELLTPYHVIRVDRARRASSIEAWVWIDVARETRALRPLVSDGPWRGVLTWPNSD